MIMGDTLLLETREDANLEAIILEIDGILALVRDAHGQQYYIILPEEDDCNE